MTRVMNRSRRHRCRCRHCPPPGCYRRCGYERTADREVHRGKGGGVVERWRSDRPRDSKCRCHPQKASSRLPLSRQTACIVAPGCVLGATIFFVVIVEESEGEIRLGSLLPVPLFCFCVVRKKK